MKNQSENTEDDGLARIGNAFIECEINPSSNLLRDGPRLTAYKLIKQQNNNLKLILAVFEGTKVDR
jgi:hypothetical protein